MTNLLAAEFLKLRSTRTPWALLAATVGVSALAVASAVVVGADSSVDLESVRGLRSVLSVSGTGALFVLVLGIIIPASEYRHGTAVDTFLTTPRRRQVIAAKLTAAAATGIVFGSIAAGASIAAASLAYRLEGFTLPLDSGEAWLAVSGAALYAMLFGAIGAATGSLVRNQVVAIVGWLAWIAVVEHIATGLLPAVGRWLPVGAGAALLRPPNAEDLLSPVAAAVVLLVYAAVIASASVVIERYRDA